MVKIRKGNHETKVTKGAYENIFKPLGYTLVGEKKVYKDEMPKVKVEEKDNNNEALKNKNKKQED